MPIENITLAQTIGSRDSSLQFDSLLMNCYPDKSISDGANVVRRFGLSKSSSFTAGTALGLFTFQNQTVTVIGTACYLGATKLSTVDSSSPYQFTITLGDTGFFLKNNTHAYFAQNVSAGLTNGSTAVTSSALFGAVATGDSVIGPGIPANTTVTVNSSSSITLSNAYTGSTGIQTLTFFGPVTDVNYPAVTVPGVSYIDGYVCVMGPLGKIWNSQVGTPRTWGALNFIQGSSNPDSGVAISNYLNYVIAFCQNTTSAFYDAGNAIDSPLAQNTNAINNVGCASATSVVATKNTIFWIGQTKQRGRSVYIINNNIPTAVSTTYIDRILSADTLVGVSALFIELDGHQLYVLTLPVSNFTLVYDLATKEWTTWSSSTPGTPQTSTSTVVMNNVVMVILPNHGLSNGSIVNITGTAAPQYLGTRLINVLDINTIYYSVGENLTGGLDVAVSLSYAVDDEPIEVPAPGSLGTLTVTPWIQNYFRALYYTYANGLDYLLDATNGVMYTTNEGIASDNGNFIYTSIRMENWDGKTNVHKFCPSIEIVGDKFADTAYLGFSDDDYQTFSPFRPVNLESQRSQVRRCGRFRRRAHQIIYIGAFPVRFYRLQVELKPGKQ